MSALQNVLAQARTDRGFRDQLKADPARVLQEAGVQTPPGKTVEIIDEQPQEIHLFLGLRSTVPELDRILERAAKDAEFKQRVLGNPRAVIEEFAGEKLPAAVQVRVHEQDSSRLRLVLPPFQDAEGELSDLELESVAGGTAGGFLTRLGTGIRNAFCPNMTTLSYTKNTQLFAVSVDYSVTTETSLV